MNVDPLTVLEDGPSPRLIPYADHWSPCVCPRCRRGRNVTIVLAAIAGALAWALLSSAQPREVRP